MMTPPVTLVALLVVACGLTPSPVNAEVFVIDDFESYHDGQIVGVSAVSKPWRRFGAATTDNVVATTHRNKLISGTVSGQYGVFWPNTFGAARYVFETPADLSAFSGASMKVLSDKPNTHTYVRFALSDGVTTFAVGGRRTVTDQIQTLTFSFDEAESELMDGDDTLERVIANVDNIGFIFQSNQGEYVETLMFDDLHLISEPDEQETLSTSGVE